MGHNQRCIQQAMAFDANIRAVQKAVCALPAPYPTLSKRDAAESITARNAGENWNWLILFS